MAVPAANELHDWLEQLPPGYVDDLHRSEGAGPTDSARFELWKGPIAVVLTLAPNETPPLEVVASAPLQDVALLEDAAFQSALAQATVGLSGWTELVESTDPAAVDESPSVVIHSAFYGDGVRKHRVLTTVLTLADAVGQAQIIAIDAMSGAD